MKQTIFFASDLHIEFGLGDMVVPEGNVLLLAGDVMTLYRNPHESYNHHDTVLKRTKKFWAQVQANFDEVYYCFGNHEHYFGDCNVTVNKTRSFFESEGISKVKVMDGEQVELDDVLLWSDTFWTDMRRADPLIMHMAKYGMNDYYNITNGADSMHPDDTVKWNATSRDKLMQFLEDARPSDKPRVVMTHHAPFFKSVPERFATQDLNFAYTNTGIEYSSVMNHDFTWIHGHMHDAVDYVAEGVRVISNPRGYWGSKETRGFAFKQLTSSMLTSII